MTLRASLLVAAVLFAAPELMPWVVAVVLLAWLAVEFAAWVLRSAR